MHDNFVSKGGLDEKFMLSTRMGNLRLQPTN
jgi:hypothetical protein